MQGGKMLSHNEGLYNAANEHDSCGVTFLCNIQGDATNTLVKQGLAALCRMEHRGGSGAETKSGDGAGILLQIPDAFFRSVVGFTLPEKSAYATGLCFLPTDVQEVQRYEKELADYAQSLDIEILGWRDVPTNSASLGSAAQASMPTIRQLFVRSGDHSGLALDRIVYALRKQVDLAFTGEVYFPSLSSQTFIYKGMLTTDQLGEFYTDLQDERITSAIVLLHSRFATNTFPAWSLAHPYRRIAHNGEINTVKGNRNWMRAREALAASESFDDIESLFPICHRGASDSASFDEVLEFLHLGGYSLAEAVLMMIPEPWERHETMNSDLRAFYQFKATMCEPWDGPASIAFTDGTVIGAVLDRNGLRPSRYWVTDDDVVIMASEVGVVEVAQNKIVEKGRLEPGKMFLIDTAAKRIIRDDEIKAAFAKARPYKQWLETSLVHLDDLPHKEAGRKDEASTKELQQAFGYTIEDYKYLMAPMARNGSEALGSMGTDTPVAVLSQRPRLLFDYFAQLFAQVTNPPLDAIREKLVTAIGDVMGPEANIFEPSAASCRRLYVPHPVITNSELASIEQLEHETLSTHKLSTLYAANDSGEVLATVIEQLCREAVAAVENGATILVLSDRGVCKEKTAVPSLLAASAVHNRLVSERLRANVGLIVETGEAREIHHFALLLGYGVNAINPYLAFASIEKMVAERTYGLDELDVGEAIKNYIAAIDKGLLKVMSKMGISTLSSYRGAQIFEAVGLDRQLITNYFPGTISAIGGADVDVLAVENYERHSKAFLSNPQTLAHRSLDVGGEYQWRREGEFHLFNPEVVYKLQHATKQSRYDIFKEYTALVDDQASQLATLRGLFKLRTESRTPLAIDDVEPVSEIVKRFATGAMSYGSISAEAHENLAIAMNRLGGKSNTGEGGEDPKRNSVDANGDSKRSAIKQVASGRFGVTSDYLVSADDIQIKMAQGAKPGEGGQLPGRKVWPEIAKTRHSTVGVGLISPPPHHDIYSIEDLAQLIFDLKNANRDARIQVKLVSETGVGTIAAGVAKARADVILISGHDGGTGASPLTSLKHAGTPWELGLAETQQTLLRNGLRDRVVLQTDGQLKTGRDVVIAALLGADEFGFATAPLVVSGCIMMRVCHLNTCPVGIATQDPQLRKKFAGTPEFVINFFEYIAEEVRELLAALGFKTLDEAIGQSQLLEIDDAARHWKSQNLDLAPLFHIPAEAAATSVRHAAATQDHQLENILDRSFIAQAQAALEDAAPVAITSPVGNTDRSVGTMLGYEVTKRYGAVGLPAGTIDISLTGSAGNSLAAFMPQGVSIKLVGDANDYVGKGLSGGKVVVTPADDLACNPRKSVIAGNVILYGATSGEAYFRGKVGERFCVRNSGAIAVVEGVGDHGCEYMTGGRVVILGPTGRNFAAGMSGGIAYVYDSTDSFKAKVNREMVDIDPLDDDDIAWLKDRIAKHGAETGSDVAREILTAPKHTLPFFVKVMPRDYKLVLQAAEEAKKTGQDVDAAIMAAVS